MYAIFTLASDLAPQPADARPIKQTPSAANSGSTFIPRSPVNDQQYPCVSYILLAVRTMRLRRRAMQPVRCGARQSLPGCAAAMLAGRASDGPPRHPSLARPANGNRPMTSIAKQIVLLLIFFSA